MSEKKMSRSILSETLFCGCSLALILASETFLLVRAASSVVSLLLLVATQVALCLALWPASKAASFLDRVSPLWVCVLFLIGVAWSLGAPGLLGAQPSSPLLVMPAAALFGLGNSLNGYHLLDYCRLSESRRFARVALGGSGVAAVLNYVISYALGSEAGALCGVLALAWYVLSRQVYRSIATNVPHDEPLNPEGTRSLGVLWLCVAALGMACGLLPMAALPSGTPGDDGFDAGLMVAIAAIACALLLAACSHGISVSSLAPIVGVFSASGLLVLSMAPSGIVHTAGEAMALVFTLASACMLCCLFARTAGDMRERPSLFWGVQVAVLLCTAAGTGVGLAIPQLAGAGAPTIPLAICLLATYCTLVYLVLFQRLWNGSKRASTEQAENADDETRAIIDIHAAASVAVAARCADLAEACSLTRREHEVLELVARGWTVDMVARQLVVSPSTVRTHLKHLYAKVGVHSRTELLGAAGVGTEADAHPHA